MSIDRPANVATPFTAPTVVVPDSVPPPGFVPITTVTNDESVVTVFPKASCTVTSGCVPNAAPAVEVFGDVEKANFAAAPGVMLNGLLVAPVSAPSAAVSV